MAAHPRPGTAVADATKCPRRKDMARSLDSQCFYKHSMILICIYIPVGPAKGKKRMERGRSRHGDDTLQEIAGLWERTSASGRAYIGGRTPDNEDIVLPAGSMVMVFPNESANPRAPAFQLLFAPRRLDQPHHPTDSGGATPARRKAGGEPLPRPAFRSRGTNPVAETAPPDILEDGEDPPVLDRAPQYRRPSLKSERRGNGFRDGRDNCNAGLHAARVRVPPLPWRILASIGRRVPKWQPSRAG